MELKELLPAFAAKLGIQGLEVRDGACAMEIDGISVELAELPDGSALAVSAAIGKPPPEKEEVFLETLLAANVELLAREGMSFGLLSETGDLVLQWRLAAASLDLDAFCARFETFVNRAEEWRQAAADFRPAAEEAVMQEENSLPEFGPGRPVFLPV